MTMAAVTARTSTVPSRLSRTRCCQLLGVPAVVTGIMVVVFLASVGVAALLGLLWCCLLRVAVQAAEEEVAEEGEQNASERSHEQPCRAMSDPAAGHPGVQVGAVDEPGEQRGRLLRVPAPVAAPRDLRPDRSEHDGHGQEGESDDDRAIAHL